MKVQTGMRLTRTTLLRVLLASSTILILIANVASQVHALQVTTSSQLSVEKANLIWERTYGGTSDERAFCIATAQDGYLVAGSSKSVLAGRTVGWILRLDSEGVALWNRTYPAEGNSEIRHILSLEEGFLLVGNLFLPSGDTDGFVCRVDLEGNLLWNLTLGGEQVDKLFSAVSTSDGFVLAGLTYSFGGGDSDAWVVKVNLAGKVVWNRTFGGVTEEAARDIALMGGNYFVAGYSNYKGGEDYDFLLMKLDVSGNMVWNKTYGGLQSDKTYAIAAVEGGLVVAGDTRSKGMGDSDAWIIKVDGDGNLGWEKTVGGVDFDMPTCIVASKYGGCLIGGFTFSFGNGKRDFWLFKLNDSGELLWSCTQGKSSYEEAYGLIEVSENEFVMAGWQNYAEGGPYDYYVVEISPGSASGWGSNFPVGLWFVAVAVVLAVFVLAFWLLRKRKHQNFNSKKTTRVVKISLNNVTVLCSSSRDVSACFEQFREEDLQRPHEGVVVGP